MEAEDAVASSVLAKIFWVPSRSSRGPLCLPVWQVPHTHAGSRASLVIEARGTHWESVGLFGGLDLMLLCLLAAGRE